MFIYNGEKYPRYLKEVDDFCDEEIIETIIRKPTGDYFLVVIHSSGEFQIKAFISNDEVSIDEQATGKSR